MPRRTYLVFGDIEGKLTCSGSNARIALARDAIVSAGLSRNSRKGNMMKWKEQLNGDCPKRDAHQLHERCDLICPDLPKVL
jgi:hypothetical protein